MCCIRAGMAAHVFPVPRVRMPGSGTALPGLQDIRYNSPVLVLFAVAVPVSDLVPFAVTVRDLVTVPVSVLVPVLVHLQLQSQF